MSKEQTPITAEEFLNNEVGKFVSLPEKDWWCKQMELYAQAKALEVLEKVKEIAWGTGLSKKEYDIFCNEIEKELKQ
jgi:hypothetical protein